MVLEAVIGAVTFVVFGGYAVCMIGWASDPSARAVTRGQRAFAMFAKVGRTFTQAMSRAAIAAVPAMRRLAEAFKETPGQRKARVEMQAALARVIGDHGVHDA